MINLIRYFYRYSSLLYTVRTYIYSYEGNNSHDIILLDMIIDKIKTCGSVAIKFCQWITPKLEVMYLEQEDIQNNSKPLWLKKLENFYENCDNHDFEYTLNAYQASFKRNLLQDYEILDIIGSGSIGQVYLLQEKTLTEYTNPQKYVMKILHPNVKNEIYYFRIYYNLINKIPFIKQILDNKFPFDINGFINSFEEQSDFINESNHLLAFQEYYKNNDMVIIPSLIKCSSDIMIMSYEEGVSFDELECDKYNKYKIALLLTSFVRNNQQIINMIHGDLHKGNWKVREENNNYKLVVYDFGFSWRVPDSKKFGNTMIADVFEDSDSEDIDTTKMTEIFKFLIVNAKEETIKEYLTDNINHIRPWNLDPHRIFNLTVKMCVQGNMKIDPVLIQSIILVIQCQKIFSEYHMLSTDEHTITSEEVYRKKYLDWLSFYKTNDIFHDYSKLIIDKLNKKQTEINNIFDCCEMPESIKNLALKNI